MPNDPQRKNKPKDEPTTLDHLGNLMTTMLKVPKHEVDEARAKPKPSEEEQPDED
ncbi:MAG TPA: hypothetical protein VND62_12010 [Acidimicrobiales bacterium]|nr:hypothetical protein [Acidimicrobiales bacterium]